MGLDAFVFCDCFRCGKIHEAPPPGWHVSIGPDGDLSCGSDDLEVLLSFDRWRHDRACGHRHGYFVHHRIGNISLIGLLRHELSANEQLFPLLLKRVMYSGSHTGDWIPLDELGVLKKEVAALQGRKCMNAKATPFLEDFRRQMEGLIMAAELVGNPICF